VDECQGACGTVTDTLGDATIEAIESDRDGFLTWEANPEDARSFCISDRLSPGIHAIAVHRSDGALAIAELTARPFGWKYGLERQTTPFDQPAWVPEHSGLSEPPSFSPQPDAWDSYSVMMPSFVNFLEREWLYYAGTADEDFTIGVASRAPGEERWQRETENPILQAEDTSPESWRRYAQNTPEALVVGEQLWLFYTGRSGTEGGLSIGLAKSDDGLEFIDIEHNPVLTPSAEVGSFDVESVAHPSVLYREPAYEMWFASGTLDIGYALSADGIIWEKYCDNPVFSGSESTWDQGKVKAPEVVFDGETYWMTYSGCGQGCYEVGWAASTDGTSWASHDAPWLLRTEAPAWNSFGLQAAFINDIQSPWEIWYTGTGDDLGQIGTITLSPRPR
jgi:predicted GH43/DUF377 family glycosyl hydrolase